jgi:DNA-directed RNA polymerase specialized sigma subunit
MTKIKYWTGKETIEVEVTFDIAAAYKESLREEWRSDKRAERHQTAISLTQMEDENGYQATDLAAPDALTVLCAAEEHEELRSKIKTALATLTPEQMNLVKMLKSGMSIGGIAKVLGVSHPAVSQMRARIVNKFDKVLR